jgi:hypothetical protein
MARHHGSHGEVQADPTGGSTLVTVASLNSWTLSQARDKVDVTAFQDTNKVYVQGLADVKGTLGGWFDDSDPTIFNIALGNIAASLSLVPSSLIPTFLWKGLGWLDASIDVKANGAISVTSSFVAAGPWTLTTT